MNLKERILQIARDNKLSHVGSALNCVDIVDDIYTRMGPDDKFILSNGHAFLAQAVVMEKHRGIDAEALRLEHGTHPHRDEKQGIWATTGSLGHGIGIALGMALANKSRDVHCLVSDGECGEGSVWEALRIRQDLRVDNLKVYVTANGFGAYQKIDTGRLAVRLLLFGFDTSRFNFTSNEPLPETLEAHYQTI